VTLKPLDFHLGDLAESFFESRDKSFLTDGADLRDLLDNAQIETDHAQYVSMITTDKAKQIIRKHFHYIITQTKTRMHAICRRNAGHMPTDLTIYGHAHGRGPISTRPWFCPSCRSRYARLPVQKSSVHADMPCDHAEW
jgi:hypothetical protein